MDKELKIEITHGKLESFTVNVRDHNKFDIGATIGLYTDAEQKITSFSIDTRSYYGDQKIDLPIGTIQSILKIAEELEVAVIRKCREGQKALPSPENYD